MMDYRKGKLYDLQNIVFFSIMENKNLGKGCHNVVIFGRRTHFTLCVCYLSQAPFSCFLFNLYYTIVQWLYLDADTIVVKNIEELFKCSKFCANLKHSERLNSCVMVVEPSETIFNDMMSKVNTLPSYTGAKLTTRSATFQTSS